MNKHIPILLGLAVIPGAALAVQNVDESRPAAPDVRLEIEIISGSVDVTAWNREEVRVTGTLGDDVEELEFAGGRDSLSIEVDVPEGWGRRNREVDAHLEISVPEGARLSVETVSAAIAVSGLTGTASLDSVSGEVTLTGRPSRAEVETVSGAIRVSGGQTQVSAESVSGSVVLEGVAQSVDVATVSGRIEVNAGEIERGQFESVAGSIHFRGGLAPGARLDAEIHSGNVVLALPGDVSATFEIETFGGSIENDFGPQPESTGGFMPGKRLEFATGSGDARVRVESFSGTVTLRRI